MKTDIFSAKVDIISANLPYNLGGIPGLQIPQSRIPGLRKGIRDSGIAIPIPGNQILCIVTAIIDIRKNVRNDVNVPRNPTTEY